MTSKICKNHWSFSGKILVSYFNASIFKQNNCISFKSYVMTLQQHIQVNNYVNNSINKACLTLFTIKSLPQISSSTGKLTLKSLK